MSTPTVAWAAAGGARLVAAAVAAGAAGRGAAWLLPRRPLPVPVGAHRVGTTTVEVRASGSVADAQVPAVGAATPVAARVLPLQVWYPTGGGGRSAPLLAHGAGMVRGVGEVYGVPPWVLSPLRRLRGNAVEGAAPLPGAWPVVVLVHGWKGFRAIHADLAERLASDGHVVVAADHVGGALAATYPDGRVVALDRSWLPPEGSPGYWAHARALVARYAEDLGAVLDALPSLLVPLGMAVEGGAVRVVGHSTGGGAAVLRATTDDRISGIVGLDPWVAPLPAAQRRVTVPTVAVRSAQWVGNDNDRLLEAMAAGAGVSAGMALEVVAGSVHTDFTVLGLLSPLARVARLAAARPLVVHDATIRALATV